MTPSDHFAVFDLPERLTLDRADLEARYHALARRFHPDRFMTRPEAEREAASDQMERANAAYRVLRDPLLRLRHVLDRHGIKADVRQGVPVELAETYFDLQETLEELAEASDEARAPLRETARALRDRIQASADGLAHELATRGAEWDADPRLETLETLALSLDRHTYLLSMLRDIDGKLSNF
ncbi:Fe-S protein assembly co-chaperone HscB [bacterium]|nr:Fe-S protein assembly co-chaperone HscB [bacterium]